VSVLCKNHSNRLTIARVIIMMGYEKYGSMCGYILEIIFNVWRHLVAILCIECYQILLIILPCLSWLIFFCQLQVTKQDTDMLFICHNCLWLMFICVLFYESHSTAAVQCNLTGNIFWALCRIVLQEACKTYSIDLISIDLSQRMDCMLFGKSARAAVGCVSL